MNELPTIQEIERVLDWPARLWENNCYAVSCAIVRAGLIRGTPRYGHYYGPSVRPRVIERHGWIELDDGSLVDPTRWVFEGVEPYIYHGPADDEEYDAGGNALRTAFLEPPPKREDDEGKPLVALRLDMLTYIVACAYLGEPAQVADIVAYRGTHEVTEKQVFWLANLPLDPLGPFAPDIYNALIAAGKGAYIPQDNRAIALDEWNKEWWGDDKRSQE